MAAILEALLSEDPESPRQLTAGLVMKHIPDPHGGKRLRCCAGLN